MTWSLEDIERDWIGGEVAALAASPDSVVAAFDRTERTLGPEWIEKSRISVGSILRGIGPTLRIVNMGQKLTVLENVTDPGRLIERIRNGDASAEGELTAIYLLHSRNPKVVVELYPRVGEREADFRVKAPDEKLWTYVEVTQLSESEAKDRAREIMERISAAIKPLRLTFALEAFLRRIPTQPEVAEILAKVPEFCSRGGKQREELSNSLGFLSLNQSDPGQVITHAHAGEENVSRLGMAHVITGTGEPRRHISIRMTFSDDRAKAMLDAEAPQLPKDAPGLIMAGVAKATGAMKTWEPLLQRRFQPQMHTRVGGVCLWVGSLLPISKGEDQLFETRLIVNPHARLPLPGWIGNTLTEINDEFKRMTSPRKGAEC
jgi:hypothetical protein